MAVPRDPETIVVHPDAPIVLIITSTPDPRIRRPLAVRITGWTPDPDLILPRGEEPFFYDAWDALEWVIDCRAELQQRRAQVSVPTRPADSTADEAGEDAASPLDVRDHDPPVDLNPRDRARLNVSDLAPPIRSVPRRTDRIGERSCQTLNFPTY